MQVEDIMDQVQEGIQDAEEIGAVLARGLGGADIMDDADLLAELNEVRTARLPMNLKCAPPLIFNLRCHGVVILSSYRWSRKS